MACRCPRSPRVLLPFLYPSFFAPNGVSRARLAAVVPGTRRHGSSITEPTSSSDSTASSRLNPAPDDYSMPNFADKAKLSIYAGGGGHGCISFLREAFMEDGPANGGDGGHGGNVYIQAVHGETSLHKLARRKIVRAGKGKSGQGSSRGGQRGDDVVIAVPVGTIVREISRDDPEEASRFLRKRGRRSRDTVPVEEGPDGEPIEDPAREKWLLYPGMSSSDMKRVELPLLPNRERIYMQPKAPVHLDLSRPTPRPILLAAGGIGGLGNPHFVTKGTPKPMFATKGERAMSMEIELELKLLADVGLVGLPNAGKSTLLRSISNSRTRIGNWAFTTLQPNIGTVVLDNNKGRPMLTSYRRVSDASPSRDDPFNLAPSPDHQHQQQPEFERRTRFTIADIPGLIEGAHLDKGLGIAFLRHVERAGVLAFVLDLGAGNAVAALKALWTEVGLYAQMREEEERERLRQAAVDWSAAAGTEVGDDTFWPSTLGSSMENGEGDGGVVSKGGLHIAGKPWFVVATKGDLPDTQENFGELREYLGRISRGEESHPSGVEGAWTHDCMAIPVSAINGQGVDRVVHWAVGLLDG